MITDALLATSPILFAALLNGALAVYSWQQRHQPGARTFAALLAAVAFWSIAYLAEVLSPGLEAKLFFGDLKYLGIAFVGPLWLMFAMIYCERGHWLNKWRKLLLLAPAFLSLSFMLTRSWHSLWQIDPRIVETGPLALLKTSYGPLFWLHTLLAYGLILVGVVLYFIHFLQAPTIFRRQTGLMLLAALIPLAGNIFFLSGVVPDPIGIDITPVLLSLTGLLIVLATFRYRLLKLMPVARRQVVDSMSDAMIVVDLSGRVVDLNPVARQMAQILPGQNVIGQPLREALKNCPKVEELAAALREASGGPTHHQIRCDERSIVVDSTISPLKQGGRGSAGHIIILRDITDRVSAEAELRQLKEFHEAIVQNMLDGVVIEDAAGCVTYANPSALRMLDYSFEQLQGQHHNALIVPSEIEKIRRESARRRQGQQGRYQTILLTRSGQQVPVLVSATPLITDGDYQGALVVFTDISDRVRLEEAQRTMIAMASHDLQSPLQVIRGYMELVIQDPDLDAETRTLYLKKGLSGVERIQNLARDLLDLTMIESGTLQLIPERLDLSTLILDAAAAFGDRAKERGLQLQVDLSDGLPVDLSDGLPDVTADRQCLERILHNLIGNAIKYTEAGAVTIKAAPREGVVEIIVQDTGLGIPPDHLDRVFERFHRIPGRPEIAGTGLGLAIAKELAERNQGRIWVESSGIPGQGSAFHVTLPVATG